MRRVRRTIFCLALALPGCQHEAPPPARIPAAPAAASAPAAERSDADLSAAILAAVGSDPGDVHYFAAAADLNGDGTAERIVYLAGPTVCGTGGCTVLIFTPDQEGFRLVAQLSVVRPPVRLSPRSAHGWRNLVVGIGGGGLAAGNAELKFDGTRYPSNPTVAPAEPTADLEGTAILIPEFDSYTDGKVIVAPVGPRADVEGHPDAP